MSRPPTFNQLADWIDGRLDDQSAAEVAAAAAAHEGEVAQTVEWLRQFRDAASLMPLQVPPASVKDAAGAAFRHLRTPPGPTVRSELSLDFDSRAMQVSGVRATAPLKAFHLELSAEHLACVVDAVSTGADQVEFSGSIVLEGPAAEPTGPTGPTESAVAVVLSCRGEERRVVPVDRAGIFVAVVEPDVDEFHVVTTTRRLSFDLDHPPREN